MAKDEKAVETTAKAENTADAFIARKMKAINEMTSPAKAKKSAERVLWNRKVGK